MWACRAQPVGFISSCHLPVMTNWGSKIHQRHKSADVSAPYSNWMMWIQATSCAKLKQKLAHCIAAWVTDKLGVLWGWITCCGYMQWLCWIRIGGWNHTAHKDFVPFKLAFLGGASGLEDRLCHGWISGEDGFRWLHVACWPHGICWPHWRTGSQSLWRWSPWACGVAVHINGQDFIWRTPTFTSYHVNFRHVMCTPGIRSLVTAFRIALMAAHLCFWERWSKRLGFLLLNKQSI